MEKIQELQNKVENLFKVYEAKHDEKISLVEPLNYAFARENFDENFDLFFDNEDLRKKYNDYDFEEEEIAYNLTMGDIIEQMDEKDLMDFIGWFEEYINEIAEEIENLKK